MLTESIIILNLNPVEGNYSFLFCFSSLWYFLKFLQYEDRLSIQYQKSEIQNPKLFEQHHDPGSGKSPI
jgi:hypothetical protein